MAISKKHKADMMTQYHEWVKKSQGMVVSSYTGLSVNQLDELRSKIREAGGEFHVLKNTLAKRVFETEGYDVPDDYFVGATAMGFAFEDAPGVAKVLADFAKESDFLAIKGGYLTGQVMKTEDVKALAELPPLPILRGKLLGTIMAPASQLVRTFAEPARQMAAVVQAYADQPAV